MWEIAPPLPKAVVAVFRAVVNPNKNPPEAVRVRINSFNSLIFTLSKKSKPKELVVKSWFRKAALVSLLEIFAN